VYKSLRALLLTIIVLNFALSGMACTSQKRPIRIAISAWAGVEPLELAEQLGYFEKQGVKVTIVRFSVYSDAIEALIDGKVDAGLLTLDDTIRYFSGGKDLRVVLLTDYSVGNDGIVARKGINTLSDLRGTKIGVETDTVGNLSLLKILEAGNLTMNDVTIFSIPTWEIEHSLLDGKIDAGVTREPYLTNTAKATGGKILITSQDYPETIITTMTFNGTIVEEHTEDVQKIVSAYFEAVEYIKTNPQDAYRRMAQLEEISAQEFTNQTAGIRYLDLVTNANLFGTKSDGLIYKQAKTIAQFLFDHDLITSLPDINQLLTPLFLRTFSK
jgi:NitT/TauT family transport system substrate-binding protein